MNFELPDLTLTVGQLKVTPLFWCLFVAFVFSSFSMWRRLIKEGYSEQEIFATNLFMLFSGIVFARLAQITIGSPEIGAFVGAVSIAVWRLKAQNKDIWEGLDTLTLPCQYFLISAGVGLFLTFGNLLYLIYSAIGLTGLFLYLFLKKRYRRFAWYKSGKIGFLFWAMSIFLSLALLVLDFFLRSGLYLTKIFFGIWLFLSAYLIFKRSRE